MHIARPYTFIGSADFHLKQIFVDKYESQPLLPLRAVDLVLYSANMVIAARWIVDGRDYAITFSIRARGVCLGARYYLRIVSTKESFVQFV
jgi:hypothetical protein